MQRWPVIGVLGWVACASPLAGDPDTGLPGDDGGGGGVIPVPPPVVVYDPAAGVLPVPNDLLRDPVARQLVLPQPPGLPAAELAFRAWLGTLPAWPTTLPVVLTMSEPVDPDTVGPRNVSLYAADDGLTWLRDATAAATGDGSRVRLDPPVGGWTPGGSYAVLVRGGPGGVRTPRGEPVEADAAMRLLLSSDPLRLDEIPGSDPSTRQALQRQLEAERARLEPLLDGLDVPVGEIAAFFRFSVHARPEVAMDRATQRVPLPFDLLRDPATGLVHLDPSPDDSPIEADAKAVASTFDGFGLSADPFLELTAGADPRTLDADAVELWELADRPRRVPVDLELMRAEGTDGCRAPPYLDDCRHLFLRLPDAELPLRPATRYAVVVRDTLRGRRGEPLAAMPLGHLVAAPAPLAVGGRSQVSLLDDATATVLEGARASIAPFLDTRGRGDVVAAWPFTTMDPLPVLVEAAHLTEDLGLDPSPHVDWRRPASALIGADALGELFPGLANPGPALYLGRVAGVREVVAGTLISPDHLHDTTRRWTATATPEPLPFWAALPEGVDRDTPAPVVIFGHAVVTDRRFLLFVAGELAKRGFVTVGIDFPYHGERIVCVRDSLVRVPNFLPPALQDLLGMREPLLQFPPCPSGAQGSCSPTGECLDPRGRVEGFTDFPIIDMQPASGAAFLDTHDLPHVPDHFRQALVDLSTLRHALSTGDLADALRQDLQVDTVSYLGQSLGSILGVVWVGARTDVDRAVFNVPGSNLVDLFLESTYFQPQLQVFLDELELEHGTFEEQRLLQVASWILDSVDPHSVARGFVGGPTAVLAQIDKIDEQTGDLIIPNRTTENLIRVGGFERAQYRSSLHADLIVPVLGDAMLRDAADFLEGP
ncbi:MAG: hypothetical protein H6732_19580 [Alphaproteobacteria bacterium]|nr:hypothetical protein [Alphaproteobacteria bacterium]